MLEAFHYGVLACYRHATPTDEGYHASLLCPSTLPAKPSYQLLRTSREIDCK
ncbi:hypothetical protein AVEN_60534-1, partial [Araneus ventricosus]